MGLVMFPAGDRVVPGGDLQRDRDGGGAGGAQDVGGEGRGQAHLPGPGDGFSSTKHFWHFSPL